MPDITEKSVVKTEAIFTEDKSHRYLLRKEWDKNKPKAMVIMTNPSSAGEISIDHTTMYVINNLLKLDFGSVDVVNIFSMIDVKISTKYGTEGLTDEENDNQIVKAATRADSIIVAWGKNGDNNKKIRDRQEQVFNLLQGYKEKLYTIESDDGKKGFHPLAPQIRFHWKLSKIDLELKKEKGKES